MMSLVVDVLYWRRAEKKDFLNKNKTSQDCQAEWPSDWNLWKQSQSFIPVTIIYAQSLFSGTFWSRCRF